MKSKVLLVGLGLISVFAAPVAKAQITIDAVDFPTPTVPFRTTFFWGNDSTQYSSPAEGADLVWNYQGITGTLNADFTYFTTSDSFFSATHHYETGRTSLPGFTIDTDIHRGLDNIGYYEYGKQQHDTSYSIAAVTGGVNDALHFVDDKQYYEGDINFVLFPMVYGDYWIDTVSRTTPFEITVAGFGLNSTPGFHKRLFEIENEVVGYGKLLMTDSNGSVSDSMEVLLQKTIRNGVDSFYIGGQPAPAQLLAGLGVVQGAQLQKISYHFYRKGYGDVLLELEVTSDAPGSPLKAMFYNQNGILPAPTVGVTELPASSFQLFPNPVQQGGTLILGLEAEPSNIAAVRIFSIDGKEVYSSAVSLSNDSTVQLNLPQHLIAGFYTVEVSTEDGNTLVTKPLVVTH